MDVIKQGDTVKNFKFNFLYGVSFHSDEPKLRDKVTEQFRQLIRSIVLGLVLKDIKVCALYGVAPTLPKERFKY